MQRGIDTELQLNPSLLDQHYPLVVVSINASEYFKKNFIFYQYVVLQPNLLATSDGT